MDTKTARIRALNDELRQNMTDKKICISLSVCEWVPMLRQQFTKAAIRTLVSNPTRFTTQVR